MTIQRYLVSFANAFHQGDLSVAGRYREMTLFIRNPEAYVFVETFELNTDTESVIVLDWMEWCE